MYIESAYKYVNVLDGINFSWLTVKTKDKMAFNVLNYNLPNIKITYWMDEIHVCILSRGLYSIPALPGSICIESKQCEADDEWRYMY